ncbi:hypothetical protein HNO89_002012 [Sporosarcina luteola]|nr:hypothetical protein [Sporosarcina luteola]
MEFVIVFGFHFVVMGLLVLIACGWIKYLFPRLNFIYIALISMMSGFLYTVLFGISQLALFAVMYNGILSLLAFGFVKLIFYAQQKAENMS